MASSSSGNVNRALRKKGGIFYTPPDISDFVTRNAITAFLLDQMHISWPANADPPVLSESLTRATKSQRESAILALEEVKILDPACGDGALLVSAAKILLEFIQLLQSPGNPKEIREKEQIVVKNVYGVDLREENVRSTQQNLVEWVYGDKKPEQEHSGLLELESHICQGNSLLGWSGDAAVSKANDPRLMPFPWTREYQVIFNAGGFDIIVANPPYGNLLTEAEIPLLGNYETLNTREIAALFLERGFQLVRKGGNVGFIIANSIAINASTAPARALIRRHMGVCRMALFGTRPGRLFPNAEIRAMLLFGKKDEPSERGTTGHIFTTDARKFFQRERLSVLKDLHYESTAGIELGQRSIGDGTPEIALPKVGFPITRQILLRLKENNGVFVRERVNQPSCHETLEIRATGGYWLTALPKFPYRSSKIRQVSVATPMERDFLILLANSSLFYLFWSTYGNLRDLKISDFLRLPFPPFEQLITHAVAIQDNAQHLTKCLLKTFEPAPHRRGGRQGEFHPGRCKTVLNLVDDIICTIYGFSSTETNFIKTYDAHLRRET